MYRDGGSDGNFDEIIELEVGGIRKALFEWNRDKIADFTCINAAKCNQQGCVHCTSPITFVVAQNDHGTRIVPDVVDGGNLKRNVPPGTVIDSLITSFRNGMRLSTDPVVPVPGRTFKNTVDYDIVEEDGGFDFFLVAQGGRIGTSRPVYYRVLLNENAVNKPVLYVKQEGLQQQHEQQVRQQATKLTRDKLKILTYTMSFLYGTASCAPRKIPLLRYSEKLARIENDSCKCIQIVKKLRCLTGSELSALYMIVVTNFGFAFLIFCSLIGNR